MKLAKSWSISIIGELILGVTLKKKKKVLCKLKNSAFVTAYQFGLCSQSYLIQKIG